VVVVTPYDVTYDGQPHTAVVTSITGVNGEIGAAVGAVDVTGTTHTNAGTYNDSWTFTGTANYNDIAATPIMNEIDQADALVTVTGTTVTYDTNAHGATGTATGEGGVDLSAGLNLGATFTDVPGGTAHWTFEGGTNYLDESGSVEIVINQADAEVTVSGTTVTYDTNAHGVTGTATGVGGVDLSAGLNLGATFTDVPGGTAHWTFEGGTNYLDESGSVAIVINKKALTVSGITANNKPFDGNTTATLNLGSAALVGVVSPDVVTLNTAGATGTFASSMVGTHVVTIAGLTIGGVNVGNYSLTQPTTTASITAWNLSGYLAPVGIANTYPGMPLVVSNTIWNTVKGGQTVPLKFEIFTMVGGTELTSVSNISGFTLVSLPCTPGTDDPVDVTLTTPGSTTLGYDGNQFHLNWQTPKGANKCYRMTMTAIDGSQLTAFFKTK
jgi:hypothetical protein